MKRFYLCGILGTGTEFDPWRAAVADVEPNHVAVLPPPPAPGQPYPAGSYAIAMVAASNHARLIGKPGIDPMPDFPMDGKVSAIQKATLNALTNRLQARGIDPSFLSNADGYRDVIRALGRRLSPDFDENSFDVSE